MKAPVGLLSDRTVLRSKMEGPRPDKFTLTRLGFCGNLSQQLNITYFYIIKSIRILYMTKPLKAELLAWLEKLKQDEQSAPEKYSNCGQLFRLPDGLPIEPELLTKWYRLWRAEHPEFPRIVFHGLRHSSATYQLMISGGDVKAVQGTTGHATADMLVNTYAHIQQSSRVELGRKFEEGFYAKQESPSPQAVPTEGEPTISVSALVELLKNADPEVKAQLRLALLT